MDRSVRTPPSRTWRGPLPALFAAGLLAASSVPAPAAASGIAAPAPVAPPVADTAPRPVPASILLPAGFAAAVEAGTRTLDGRPGPRYWQQRARYRLRASLDPTSRRLDGRARIAYENRSPDTLDVLRVKLYQNLHAPGVPRHVPAEVTGGVELRRVAADGVTLTEGGADGPRYAVDGTVMGVWLPRPLAPGDSAALEVDWGFRIPQDGASGRMGWSGDDLFYLAYWYPQMEVYDDVVGWHDDPFTGRAEFYAGFGDYELEVEVPEGWVVLGTGALVNPEEVLPERILERLRRAEASDDVVHVLARDDFGPGRATRRAADGRLTWRLVAPRVRDVAFAVTRGSLWDAARAPVGDRDGDGETDYARVDALYRPHASRWRNAWRFTRHSVDFLSRWLDLPYPWPHMSAVEGGGIIGGGMEYPMMTLIGDYVEASSDSALYAVIAHEIAHMWVPMIVSNDEVRWAWMDEGTTSFNENQAEKEFYPGVDHDAPDREQYVAAAANGFDATMMRWTDWEYPQTWGVAAYPKPATALVALRALLGEETFVRALRAFVADWAWKHPKPWDFFHTFEREAGRDLDWFWRGWYFEQWTLDHAVARVRETREGPVITVVDHGGLPMPARVTVERADGSTTRAEVPVERWLSGAREAELRLPPGAPVVRAAVDAEGVFPDVNRGNDAWERPAPASAGGDDPGRRETTIP